MVFISPPESDGGGGSWRFTGGRSHVGLCVVFLLGGKVVRGKKGWFNGLHAPITTRNGGDGCREGEMKGGDE